MAPAVAPLASILPREMEVPFVAPAIISTPPAAFGGANIDSDTGWHAHCARACARPCIGNHDHVTTGGGCRRRIDLGNGRATGAGAGKIDRSACSRAAISLIGLDNGQIAGGRIDREISACNQG